jgi:hypothetical protein
MAADAVSVDAMLADAISKMDALTKRMDALEVGEKKIIKGDDDDDDRGAGKKRGDEAKGTRGDASSKTRGDAKAKSDDDDDDDDARKGDDAIRTPKTTIKDAAKGASADAANVPPPPVKGDDGELEIKHKRSEDSAKKDDDDDDDDDDKKKGDALPPQFKKKAKVKDDDDDDDDKKKDDAVKDDAVDLRRQIADQAAVIRRLEAMMKPRSDDEHAAFADAQARADAVFSGFGQRAPRPLDGETLFDYRKRLATKLKSHSAIWKSVKLSILPEEAFKIAEDQVYNDAAAAASNPVDLEAGELRMVTKIDPTTGVRSNVFYGKESFVKGMGRPGRRVASFRTLASQ